MTTKVGLDCRAYYNASGDWNSPDFRHVASATEVSLNLETGEADISTRGSTWRKRLATLLDATITITAYFDNSAAIAAFRAAYLSRSAIEVLILDGPIEQEGAEGLRAVCQVMSFNRGEPLEEGVTVEITLQPTVASHEPEWYVVGS